jgi:long-subunit fatty acid transport protein
MATDYPLTSVDLHGKIDTSVMGISQNSTRHVEVILPAEYTFSTIVIIDPILHLSASYRKRLWSEYKVFDVQIKNPALETLFGTPSLRMLSDAEIYRFGIGKCIDNHHLNLFGGWNRGGLNPSTASFSSPPAKIQFFGGDYSYDFSTTWSIGARYSHIRLMEQSVEAPILKGSFLETSGQITTLYLKKKF